MFLTDTDVYKNPDGCPDRIVNLCYFDELTYTLTFHNFYYEVMEMCEFDRVLIQMFNNFKYHMMMQPVVFLNTGFHGYRLPYRTARLLERMKGSEYLKNN